MRFPKRKNRTAYSGVTFIEVMVTIAIISILSTISIISYNSIQKNAFVDSSVDAVFSALTMAKGYSLQGKMPSTSNTGCGYTSICGYGFRFTSSTHYEVFYYYSCPSGLGIGNLDCSNAGTSQKVPIDGGDLGRGVALSSPAFGSSTVYFAIPWGVLTSSLPQDYKMTSSSVSKDVTVNATGLIAKP